MKVLITGGTGFLGLHLGKSLVERNHEVILFDNSSHDFTSSPACPGMIFEGDVADIESLQEIISQYKVESVVHLAALLTEPCANNPVMGTKVNCVGTAAVFHSSSISGVRKVIYGSSVAVYRPTETPPNEEFPPVDPPSVYGVTKVFAENLARVMAQKYRQTEFLGLRFGWVYGPGRRRGWNVLQEVIEGFALEQEIIPYPDYQEKNDWTHVNDAVSAIITCLEASKLPNPLYNVTGDYRQINEAIRHLTHLFPNVRTHPYPAKLPSSAWNFVSKQLSQDTGFRPSFLLEQGLEHTIAEIRSEYGLSSVL
jgi:UDP-glucose 4-epimerase